MNHNDLCLLRKGGFILGPYTYEKTKTLLLQREIKVIDEVLFPGSYWAFVRDCPRFAKIVESLRQQELITDEENTETVNRYSTNISYTSSMAKLSNVDLLEGRDKRFVSAVEVLESHSAEKNSSAGEVHYASQGYAKKKSKKGLSLIWLCLGALVIAGGFLFYNINSFDNNEAGGGEQSSIDYVSEGFNDYQMGHYADALENFKSSYNENKNNSEILIPYATLLLNDDQTIVASRVFNKAITLSNENKNQALVGIGLIHLINGEVRFADKNFEEALKLRPQYVPALYNLGITNYYKGYFPEASEFFSSSFELDKTNIMGSLMQILSTIKIYEITKNTSFLGSAKIKLNQFINSNSDYKQEAILLSVYLSFLENNTEKFKIDTLKLLDVDPYLTKNHKANLLLHRGPLTWRSLNKEICAPILRSLNFSKIYEAQLLEVYCKAKAGLLSGSEMAIRSIRSQRPSDPLVGAIESFVQAESNNTEAALITIGNAVDNNRSNIYKLPIILQAHFCELMEDYSCSLKYWTELTSKEPDNLQAKVGRAKAQIKLDRTPSVTETLNKIRGLSDTYIPLLGLVSSNSSVNR